MQENKDTLRARILIYLKDNGDSSLSELARVVGAPMSNIRDKLFTAKRNGHATFEIRRMIGPSGGPLLSNMWHITEEGKKWLELVAQP